MQYKEKEFYLKFVLIFVSLVLLVCVLFGRKSQAESIDIIKGNNIYSQKINLINGDKLEFDKFKNKHILIVNIASKCGFTSQLKSLQLLQDKNIDDLIIIGVPSNDFMNQEPLNNSQIDSFCKINYGVTFLITEKIKVKGDLIHPLFEFLTNKDLNGWLDKAPSWNFNKYLINKDGHLIKHFGSMVDPNSTKITKFFSSNESS